MEGDSKETSLKGLFQGMIPEAVELLQGTVIQESPLRIQMTNDSKLIISENITVVPRSLTDHELEADVRLAGGSIDSETGKALSPDSKTAGAYGSEQHIHKLTDFTIVRGVITVHNHLAKGDKVHVLAIQNGKKYFVLDRV